MAAEQPLHRTAPAMIIPIQLRFMSPPDCRIVFLMAKDAADRQGVGYVE
jgi:hypothetical protein